MLMWLLQLYVLVFPVFKGVKHLQFNLMTIIPKVKLLLINSESLCFQVFRKFGVEKFDPANEPFDPHRHNAVFQVPDNSKPPGTVAHVLKVLFSSSFWLESLWLTEYDFQASGSFFCSLLLGWSTTLAILQEKIPIQCCCTSLLI